LETASNLEGIVDPPLETRKRTNHEDTSTEAIPETLEADLSINGANCATSLVHDGDHSVSGVRHDSAEDTSPVTSQEGNCKLLVLAVSFTRFGEDICVECSHCLFEDNELNDSVWDLSCPKWVDTLVETVPSFGLHDLGPSFSGSLREGSSIGSLHSDFELKTESY